MPVNFDSFQTINWFQFGFALLSLIGAMLIWARPRFRGLVLLLVVNAAYMFLNTLGKSIPVESLLPLFTLIVGPAVYLFVRNLVYPDVRFSAIQVLHFSPAFLAIPLVDNANGIVLAGLTLKIVYTLAALRLIRKYHRASYNFSAQAESTRLSWVYWLLVVFVSISAIETFRFAFDLPMPQLVTQLWHEVYLASAILLCGVLIVKAMQNQLLFDDLKKFDSWLEDREALLEAGFCAQSKADFKTVERAITEQKLYLKPDLTLDQVAEHTQLSPAAALHAIHQGAGCNFCDYINGHRIEAMKHELSEAKLSGRALKELAQSIGLASNLNIKALFRRFSGSTPEQYLHSHRS